MNLLRCNDIIIMDNVSFHKTTDVKSFLRNNNINFDFLPVYSPEKNPIEIVFSSLKSPYYNLQRPNNFFEIKKFIERVLNDWRVNFTTFERFYIHMRYFLDKAFLREPF
ncbi:hypothetical protein DMUE_3141 [Dictyocoela muelleri]|nr:hypothetical protein DMUE_3141 [Dictyocoela muelleri]